MLTSHDDFSNGNREGVREEGGLKRVQEKIFAAGGSNATLATIYYLYLLS